MSYLKDIVHYKEMPLDIHGLTLDKIFLDSSEDFIFLLDSDAELVNTNFFNFEYLDSDLVFGIGFINEPGPFIKESSPLYRFMYYQERMFIPCTLLKVNYIKKAINNGLSFRDKTIYNESRSNLFGKILAARFRFKFFQKHDFILTKPFRNTVYTYNKPSMIYFDTGAEIYCYLKYKMNLKFLGISAEFSEDYVKHYHGLTRKVINQNDNNTGNRGRSFDFILNRLYEVYNIEL